MVEGREAQAERVRSAAGINAGGGYWDQRAAGFREGVQQRGGETAEVLGIISPFLTSSSTVLDVGAGVGRYTIPLAKQAARVTAVEPSTGMRGYLEEDARTAGLTNVTVVLSAWEAANVEPCDIVLCSHVVYFISGIRAFLEKVRDNARGQVFMAIRTNQRDAALRELWEIVHKEPRVPEPGLMDLYPTLRQVLGVTANVQVVTYGGGRNPLGRFDSVEDAMPEVRRQLLLAEGSPSESAALVYLRERMVQEDGKWVLPSMTVANAVVWWDNRSGSRNLA